MSYKVLCGPKKTASFKNKFVLPLVLYYDDYETNNPLGTHRGLAKIGAIYVSIPCLPPQIASKFLETEGVKISHEHGEKTVYFSLVTVLGDNLGANSILCFTSSFSANYCC